MKATVMRNVGNEDTTVVAQEVIGVDVDEQYSTLYMDNGVYIVLEHEAVWKLMMDVFRLGMLSYKNELEGGVR